MTEVRNSIKVVARQTGLSPHVIRAWERRYGAVRPTRTATHRRMYLASDIERLSWLHQATRNGHSIGTVVRLTNEQLRQLLSGPGESQRLAGAARGQLSADELVRAAMDAVRDLKAETLEALLEKAAVRFGQHGLLERVIGPLASSIGDQWQSGALTAAHEHMATGVVRLFLSRISKPFAGNASAAGLVVATPTGQLHELGAVMAAAAAADVGWRVLYLGSSLPAPEIAGAALQHQARAVALSLVYPEDDVALPDELRRLRRCLPADIALLAGGRALPAYRAALREVGALACERLEDFYAHLARLRRTPSPAK